MKHQAMKTWGAEIKVHALQTSELHGDKLLPSAQLLYSREKEPWFQADRK
jgi:hypothetical protein